MAFRNSGVLRNHGRYWAATIFMTAERTTLPVDEWQLLVDLYSGESHPFVGYSEEDGFRIEVIDKRIHFIFTFEEGYDYLIYDA